MKRQFDHSAPASSASAGLRYWRSLDELAETPGFREQVAREFPEGAASLEGVDRRQFMKLMAASFALGGLGLAGCRRPETNILPYGKSVEYTVPGLPLYYATAMPLRRSAIPLLAETHQGRPTKLEGNPSYLPHGGASSLLAQASVLDLYDPDRAQQHTQGGRALSPAEVNDLLARLHQSYAGNGEGLAFLADESGSPTRARLVAKLQQQFPRALWAEYEPVQDEPPAEAALAAFGRPVKPLYRFAKARRILSLDADFLHAEAGSLYHTRQFSQGRRVSRQDGEMNRLYVVESGFTLTGSMADHRLRLATSHQLALAAALAGRLLGVNDFKPYAEGLDFPKKDEWIEACAQDLLAHKGECLIVAGAHLPVELHLLVNALNEALGNYGRTVDFVATGTAGVSSLSALATAIKAGGIKTLVVLNGNPAYNAPADLDFPALLKSVPEVIRYGYYADETSALAGTHLAATHYLESWGDARTVDGTIVPVQPMILPLFGGLMEVELLARLAGEAAPDAYTQVVATIAGFTDGSLKAFEKFLHDGLLEGSAYAPEVVTFNHAVARERFFRTAPSLVPLSEESVEVRFVTDHKMDDGRFANNGWLQEVPDPITKLSWDNVILVSPRLARKLGIYPKGAKLQVARVELAEVYHYKEQAYIGEVTVDGRTVRGPLHIQPGLANYTVVLPLGYGRTHSGHIGTGSGFSAYGIRASAAPHCAVGRIRNTGERQSVATTQEHWSMEGRDIVREANLDEYRENPLFVREATIDAHAPSNYGKDQGMSLAEKATVIPRGNSLYETPQFDGIHQWGMSIDLNTCTGCNACVVACQAENNIPIVGREQAKRGREMHWIRLDRYYTDGRIDSEAFGAEGNREIPEDPQA
ncbi:MAG: TAT-variant-translocated molybdopterin oxidoreductase, partial [Opitutales bacterium]